MARLTILKPKVAKLAPMMRAAPPRVSADTGADWSSLYDLQAWRRKPDGLRWRTLVRDSFICRMCGRLETDTSKLHADHKTPHRGDMALFLDPDNVWCLCETCHNRDKQAIEKLSLIHI